jgi:uncharacterized protein (TIGR02246 family)
MNLVQRPESSPMHLRLTIAVCAAALSLNACNKHGEKHGGSEELHATVVRPDSHLPSKTEIAALFDKWNETLQTGGPYDMAMLYAEDGVLLPTVSNQPRNNRPEIADYFEHFLQKKPRGTINEQYIEVLDGNTAINSGVYTFDMLKDGQPAFVVARYSYVYEKIGGKWLIKSHHSSAMPEPVEGRPPALSDRLTASATASPAHGGGHLEANAGELRGHQQEAEAKPSHGGGDHGGGHH